MPLKGRPTGDLQDDLQVVVLAITPSNVIFSLFVTGVGKHCVGAIELEQFTQIHKGGVIRHARPVVHIMGDNHNGKTVLRSLISSSIFQSGDRV